MRADGARRSSAADAAVPPDDPLARAVVEPDDTGGAPRRATAAWPSTADGDWLRGVTDFAGFERRRRVR
jgi:hypothetical protein